MQSLRFKRYATVFKACHELSYEKIDLYRVFYEPSVNLFVGPQLRKDLFKFGYSEFFKQPQLIAEKIGDTKAATFCYVVILEANDDPFTV